MFNETELQFKYEMTNRFVGILGGKSDLLFRNQTGFMILSLNFDMC